MNEHNTRISLVLAAVPIPNGDMFLFVYGKVCEWVRLYRHPRLRFGGQDTDIDEFIACLVTANIMPPILVLGLCLPTCAPRQFSFL